jgi:PAS domain S-box-containing protein
MDGRRTATRAAAVVLACWLAPWLAFPTALGEPWVQGAPPASPLTKHVILLFSESASLPTNAASERALREAMDSDASLRIEYHYEFLDLRRFGGADYAERLTTFLSDKYKGRPVDLVVPIGPGALSYVVRHGQTMFPGVPVVFCNVLPSEERMLKPGTGAGVAVRFESLPTLEAALRMQPGVKKVVVVSGLSDLDKAESLLMRRGWEKLEGRVAFESWEGLSVRNLVSKVAALAPDTVVFYCDVYQDGEGRFFVPSDVVSLISPACKVPIYGVSSACMGLGIVGGYLYDYAGGGTLAGKAALEVLHGAAPASIRLPAGDLVAPTYDARELKRFGIRESALPQGSRVRFKVPSVWAQRPWLVVGVFAFAVGETLLLVVVIVALVKRRRAEAEARDSEARLSLAAASAQMGFWEWRADWKEIWASPPMAALFGLQDAPKLNWSAVDDVIHPEDLQRVRESRQRALSEPGQHSTPEYRVLRPDGGVRWISTRGASFLGPSGKVERLVGVTMDITERKEAEERLRASEERYRAFLTYSTEGVCRYEARGGFPVSLPEEEQVARMYESAFVAECNEAFAKMLGRASAEEMVGLGLAEVLPSSDPRNVEYLRAFIRNGYRMLDAESFKLDAQGNTHCVSSSAVGIVKDGRLVQVWSIQRDITERKRVETALRENEARFRSLFEQSPIGIYRTTPDGRILAANPALIRKLGYGSLEELAARNLESAGYAPSYPREEFKRCLERDGEVRGFEATWTTKSGGTLEVRENARAIRDSEGSILYYEGTAEDVTDQRRAERALGESETRYRDLFEAAMDGMAVADAETGILVECNGALLAMVGRTRDELIGHPQAVLHPPQKPFSGLMGSFARRRANPNSGSIEDKLLHKDGSLRDVEVKAALFDMGGRPHLLGIFRDVTERKRTEAALRESQAQLISLVESTNDLIWSVDAQNFGLLTFNDALRRYFLEASGLKIRVGMTPAELLPPEFARQWVEFYTRVLREGPFTTEYKTSSGTRTLSLSFNLVKQGTEVIGISVFGGDITERRRAELEAQELRQELSHVTRVTMMGELTASLAHELNQPLTAIRTNAQAAQHLLSQGALDAGEFGEILADIVADDQRASEIIRHMRGVLKKGEFETQILDLNELILEVATLVRPDAALRDVKMTLDLAPGLPTVRGDRVQLQQVLLNLMVNGIDAMKDLDARMLTVRTWAQSDGEVWARVRDSGGGIREGQLARIFDPFVTTKPEGMGMGLSICRSIVQAHGGRIWAENAPERGASLTVVLPAAEEKG